jgi:hypothetical protein
MEGLTVTQAQRVGVALDVAILYGALERLQGNASLSGSMKELQRAYDLKVQRLQSMGSET